MQTCRSSVQHGGSRQAQRDDSNMKLRMMLCRVAICHKHQEYKSKNE